MSIFSKGYYHEVNCELPDPGFELSRFSMTYITAMPLEYLHFSYVCSYIYIYIYIYIYTHPHTCADVISAAVSILRP